MRHDEDVLDVATALESAFKRACSVVYGSARTTSKGGVYALYFRVRPGGDWIAVAKRYHPTLATPEVAFGNGRSVIAALVDLNKAMSGQKWKADRPYEH